MYMHCFTLKFNKNILLFVTHITTFKLMVWKKVFSHLIVGTPVSQDHQAEF